MKFDNLNEKIEQLETFKANLVSGDDKIKEEEGGTLKFNIDSWVERERVELLRETDLKIATLRENLALENVSLKRTSDEMLRRRAFSIFLGKLKKSLVNMRYDNVEERTASFHVMCSALNNEVLKPNGADFYAGLLPSASNDMSTFQGEEGMIQGTSRLRLPSWMWDSLREHQREAVWYLSRLYYGRPAHGAILGDEMGLGKTVTAVVYLSVLASLTDKNNILFVPPSAAVVIERVSDILQQNVCNIESDITAAEVERNMERWYKSIPNKDTSACLPVLILCPVTLEEAWEAELNLWMPQAAVYRFRNLSSPLRDLLESSVGSVVVIASYEAVRPIKSQLLLITWGSIICDEAHRLKNRQTKLSERMLELRTSDMTRVGGFLHGGHRILLTGTPIQNNLDELWSLADFVNPGMLGSIEAFRQLTSHVEDGDKDNPKRGYYIMEIRKLLSSVLLRRSKRDIVDFSLSEGSGPQFRELVVLCGLSWSQFDYYHSVIAKSGVRKTLDRLRDRDGRNLKMCRQELLNGLRSDSLRLIQRLRHICNSPMLEHYTMQDLGFRLALGVADSEKTDSDSGSEQNLKLITRADLLRGSYDNLFRGGEDWITSSAKFRVLARMFHRWAIKGEKFIIYSGSVRALQLVNILVNSREHKITVEQLTGATPLKKRQELVERFQHGSILGLLMTTRVGGLGLNLSAAQNIVLLDPDWNPQIDNQAKLRATRLNSEGAVTVYRLVAQGTLEESVLRRQILKHEISVAILDNSTKKGPRINKDLRDLFQDPRPPADSEIPEDLSRGAAISASRGSRQGLHSQLERFEERERMYGQACIEGAEEDADVGELLAGLGDYKAHSGHSVQTLYGAERRALEEATSAVAKLKKSTVGRTLPALSLEEYVTRLRAAEHKAEDPKESAICAEEWVLVGRALITVLQCGMREANGALDSDTLMRGFQARWAPRPMPHREMVKFVLMLVADKRRKQNERPRWLLKDTFWEKTEEDDVKTQNVSGEVTNLKSEEDSGDWV